MSWSVFKTKCAVLTGNQHVSRELFSQTISSAYNTCISMHFDTLTAGGHTINNAAKLPALYNGILGICNANMAAQTDVNFIAQIGPLFQAYWAGIVIVGPTGTVTVLSPGTWQGPKVVQNFDFQILLNVLILTARTHIMTLTGTYVSSVVPGVTSPWSGAMLQSLP